MREVPLQHNRSGDLTHIDGVRVDYLGAGGYATAYKGTAPGRRWPEAYLLLDDALNDGARDVYAKLYAQGVPHMPAVELLGTVPHGRCYRMPFYQVPPTGEAHERMLALSDAAMLRRYDLRLTAGLLERSGQDSLATALRALADNLPGRPRDWVIDDIGSNLGEDRAGDLILLDAVYNTRLGLLQRSAFAHPRHNPGRAR